MYQTESLGMRLSIKQFFLMVSVGQSHEAKVIQTKLAGMMIENLTYRPRGTNKDV